MRSVLIASFALLPLAAPAAAQQMRPGMWETTARTVDFDMALPPGTPAGVADMMKRQMGSQTFTHKQCITAEDLKDAPEKMFKQTDGQCRYEKFSMAGGRLDAVAVCKMQGSDMRMTMSGNYTPTTYRSGMTMAGSGAMGDMTIKSEGTGKRIGDC